MSRLGDVTGFKVRVCSSMGANVVSGVLVLKMTGSRTVGRAMISGASVPGTRSVVETGLNRGASGVGVVLGLGHGRRVRFDVLGARVITQASVLSVTGSKTAVGTNVVPLASGLRVTGSRAVAGTGLV